MDCVYARFPNNFFAYPSSFQPSHPIHLHLITTEVAKPILLKRKKTLRGELKGQISLSLLFYLSRRIAVYFQSVCIRSIRSYFCEMKSLYCLSQYSINSDSSKSEVESFNLRRDERWKIVQTSYNDKTIVKYLLQIY